MSARISLVLSDGCLATMLKNLPVSARFAMHLTAPAINTASHKLKTVTVFTRSLPSFQGSLILHNRCLFYGAFGALVNMTFIGAVEHRRRGTRRHVSTSRRSISHVSCCFNENLDRIRTS